MSATISNVTHFTSKSTNIDVLRYVALSFTAMFAVYAAMIFTQRLKNRAIKLMNIKMKENFIYQKLVHSKFNDDATGKISQIFNDFKLIEQQYFGLIFELITSLLTGVVSAIYILTLNIPVGLLFILFSTLPMVSSKLFSKQLTEAAAVWQSDSSRFLSKVTDLFNGINSIRTYHAQKQMFSDTENYLDKMEDSYERMNNRQVAAMFVTVMLSLVSFLLPLGAGLFFVVNFKLSPAVVIGIFLASDRVVGPLRNAAQYLNMMKTTLEIRKGLTDEIIEFDDSENKTETDTDILMENVDFEYDENHKILHNLSLNVPYGTKLLVTGPSGRGKSTILNLIQGFLKPTHGKIEIDHNSIAYIQQDPFLFDDSLRFNLTLGKTFTSEQCLKVLDQVGLVEELGSDLLDKSFGEGGKQLSGGQRQRVEIARALLFNKKVILLDEATSNLDEQMSLKIRQIVWQLPVTIIEVSHKYDEAVVNEYGVNHYELRDGQLLPAR